LFCLDLLWQLPDNGGSTCAANSWMYALASLWRPWVWVSCTNLYRGVPLIFCIAPWGKSQCQWFWFPPFGPGGVEYLVQIHQKYILFSFTWTESHWPHTPPFNHFLTHTNAPNHADWALHSLTHSLHSVRHSGHANCVLHNIFLMLSRSCLLSVTHPQFTFSYRLIHRLTQSGVSSYICVCVCMCT
jgi:hypothetical protein